MNKTLRDYQLEAVNKAIKHGKQLICFDTGLGKTITSIAVTKHYLVSGIRTIYFMPLAVAENAIKDFSSELGSDYSYSLIRESGHTYNASDYNTDVVFVSIEALNNEKIWKTVVELICTDNFKHIVIDEVQTISNVNASNINNLIYFTGYNAKYLTLLSATPLISKPKQFAWVLTLLFQDTHMYFSLLHEIHQGKYAIHSEQDLISYKVRDSKYQVELYDFSIEDITSDVKDVTLFAQTRNNKYSFEALSNIIEKNKGKFIIYSHLTSNHKPLKEWLEKQGYNTLIVSGQTNNEDIEKKFEGYDCAIYSIHKGINLPADYCIMYDWNVYAHQAIGRGLRTLNTDNYKAIFMLSDDENEQASWLNSTVSNMYMFKKVLGHSVLSNLSENELLF